MMELLKARFSEHKELHPDLEWSEVEHRLREFPAAIAVLQKMEESGGEPDTIGYDEQTGKLIFCDCAKESPSGRRSLCYDEKALQGRTKNPPSGSTERIAKEIGVSMMTEELYRRLQSLGYFDLKTSSWIATPDDIRSKGGALFCELCFERGIIVPTEEIHHKLPLSEGGTHDRSNLIALCKSCHSTIHAKRGDYWGRTMSGGHRLCADRSEAETHRG